MKRFLSTLLCALLMLGLLPAVSQPARMITNFWVFQSGTVYYIGESFWVSADYLDGVGPYKYSFDVYKGYDLIVNDTWHDEWSVYYTPAVPGTYKVYVWVWDQGNSTVLAKYSLPIAVPLRPSVKITKVEATGGTSLKLTWDAVSGASGYEVWRAKSKTGVYTRVKVTEAETFTNSWLTPGQQYFYKVRAYNYPDGNYAVSGKFGAIRSGVPLAKAKITGATGVSNSQIKLTWTKVTWATGYQILRSTSATGTYQSIKLTTALAFTAGGMLHAKTYYFKVRPYKKIRTAIYYGPLSGYRAGKTK